MTCAIVLSCYNGEKYITEQLESLLRQSRQPDRVVIWDDGSSDTTPSIVESFGSISCQTGASGSTKRMPDGRKISMT